MDPSSSPELPEYDDAPSWSSLLAALAAEPALAARFAEGRDRRSRFRSLRTIGRGSEGSVRCALSLDTGELVAVKACRKPAAPEPSRALVRTPSAEAAIVDRARVSDELRRRFEALQALEHPNLVRMLEQFETESRVYTVTELCEGDLAAFLEAREDRRLPEHLIRPILLAVLRALSHLHAHGIVHRDLKPSNILLRTFSNPADLCLADFGSAKVHDPTSEDHRMKTLVGTPFYIAPELIQGLPYGPEVDLYPLGVIAFELACGSHPFAGAAGFADLYARAARGDWEFPPGVGSPELRDLVRGLMRADPAARMGCAAAAAHPFFAGHAGAQRARPRMAREMSGTAVTWSAEARELRPAETVAATG
ncbi:kinase-like domain-containing protein [Hyaloraphidium curvatum]|nr:kinase-like domain-containing protein [Hyaloraphidium curvatum]